MKTLAILFAAIALVCGCRTHENQGGTFDNSMDSQMNSKGTGTSLTQTNNTTQGAGAQGLSNTNSASPSNP